MIGQIDMIIEKKEFMDDKIENNKKLTKIKTIYITLRRFFSNFKRCETNKKEAKNSNNFDLYQNKI